MISDQKLTKNLREKFGNEAVLVYDNWSAGSAKLHEPTRGVGIRRMFQKGGLKAYLIDEFKTSTVCLSCQNGALEKYKEVKNPRPYQRGKSPVVLCNGLLR